MIPPKHGLTYTVNAHLDPTGNTNPPWKLDVQREVYGTTFYYMGRRLFSILLSVIMVVAIIRIMIMCFMNVPLMCSVGTET